MKKLYLDIHNHVGGRTAEAVDEAPDLTGIQNVWIQGVGCGEANVHFNP